MKRKTQEEALGVRLKRHRLDKGFTQKRMGEILGLSRVTINAIENGGNSRDLIRVRIEKHLNGEQAA